MDIPILFGQKAMEKVMVRVIPVFIVIEAPFLFWIVQAMRSVTFTVFHILPMVILGFALFAVILLTKSGKILFDGSTLVFQFRSLPFTLMQIPRSEVKSMEIVSMQIPQSMQIRKMIVMTTTTGKKMDFCGKDEQETQSILTQLQQMIG